MSNSYICLSEICENSKKDYKLFGGRAISKEEAQNHFDNYYSIGNEVSNYESHTTARRAKILDMQNNKQDKFLIDLNQDNASEYLKPKGPNKYDIIGIDAFSEGSEFLVEGRTFNNKGVAKTKEGRLYSDHFRQKYLDEHKDEHLVEQHWRKYRRDQEQLKKLLEEVPSIAKPSVSKIDGDPDRGELESRSEFINPNKKTLKANVSHKNRHKRPPKKYPQGVSWEIPIKGDDEEDDDIEKTDVEQAYIDVGQGEIDIEKRQTHIEKRDSHVKQEESEVEEQQEEQEKSDIDVDEESSDYIDLSDLAIKLGLDPENANFTQITDEDSGIEYYGNVLENGDIDLYETSDQYNYVSTIKYGEYNRSEE